MVDTFRAPAALPRTIPDDLVARAMKLAGARERFDGFPFTTRALGEANAAHYRAGVKSGKVNEATFWTWECVEALRSTVPALCWETCLFALDAAETPRILGCVAAGPLEDLIHDNGDGLIDEIEVLSRRSARFRLALSMVWAQGNEERVYWGRVVAAARAAIAADDDAGLPQANVVDAWELPRSTGKNRKSPKGSC